jgi:integrase
MKLILTHRLTTEASVCPYRVIDEQGQETVWANDFLDAQHMRQLSPRSLRAYAYDLLHFARWFQSRIQSLSEITESTLLDYVRYQLNQRPQPTPQTINHRLTVIRCLYRFHLGQEIPGGHPHFQRIHTTRCPLGYGRPHRTIAFGLRLRQPRRVIQPLSAEQVAKFWASFRTFRDLAVVGLMLLDGLGSCEILTLQLEDLKLADAQNTRSGQGQETAHPATARRNHGSASKLHSPGTAADQLPLSVCFLKGSPAWSTHDDAGAPLAVPPSSIAQ